MVAAVKPQFAVGDRVRIAPIKPTDAHLWGKEGVVQSGLRANGTLTVNLDGGKLRSFRPLELEAIPHEKPTPNGTGDETPGDRPTAAGTGNGGDRPTRRRKTRNGAKTPDEAGRPGSSANGMATGATQEDAVVSGGGVERNPFERLKNGVLVSIDPFIFGRFQELLISNPDLPGLRKTRRPIARGMSPGWRLWRDDQYLDLAECDGQLAIVQHSDGETHFNGSTMSSKKVEKFVKAILEERTGTRAIAPTHTETLDEQIDRLYHDATEAEETAIAASKAAAQLYFELGEKLLQRRATLKHGEWLPYLEGRNIHKRKAQRAIQVFKHFDGKSDSLTRLTLTEALQEAGKQLSPADEEESSQVRQKDLTEAMDAIERGIEERKAAALDYGSGVAPETAQALADAGVMPCKPSITPEEFNRETWGEKGVPVFGDRRCENCDNESLRNSKEYRCEVGQFAAYGGTSRFQMTGCSKFVKREAGEPTQPAPTEAPKGLSMLETIIWSWLGMHRYEATEDAVKDAAIAINEFLVGQFLEANDDE